MQKKELSMIKINVVSNQGGNSRSISNSLSPIIELNGGAIEKPRKKLDSLNFDSKVERRKKRIKSGNQPLFLTRC